MGSKPPLLDKCSHCFSSKKPLFIADGDHLRKPQLDTMQTAPDCERPHTSGYMDITASASLAQGTWGKRGRGDFKSQRTTQSAPKQFCFSNGCINKTGKIAVSWTC